MCGPMKRDMKRALEACNRTCAGVEVSTSHRSKSPAKSKFCICAPYPPFTCSGPVHAMTSDSRRQSVVEDSCDESID